jgi:hemoglobin
MKTVAPRMFAALVVAALLIGAAGLAAQAKQDSLYKRLGGYDALAAVTDDFIGRLATDPQLGKFFVGHSTASLKRIRQLVVEQLCEATGGPCYYIGRSMKESHAGMNISDADWDAAVKHLVATLDKFKVPQKEKDEVLGAISGLKADIVTAPSAAPPKKM